jgi:hypothetical protein
VRLTPAGFDVVRQALTDAFGDATEFALLARDMRWELVDLVGSEANRPAIVKALIERAEKEDSVEKLIACASKQRPGNYHLATITADDLAPAMAPQEVAEEGEGTAAFKRRLVETLAQLDRKGMEVVAADELSALLEGAQDIEARTFYLVLVGTVRYDRGPAVTDELAGVFAAALRRRLAGGRPAGAELDLARVRLPRVDLSGLDLHGADLYYADLSLADLKDVNLWRSRAYGVDVSKADLSLSNLEEVRWHGAAARGTRFRDCRMVSAFFKEADLRDAAFQRSRLQGAHFEQANLTGARFEGANVSDARFTGAKIDEAAARSLARAPNWQKAHFDLPIKQLVADFAANG